LPGYVAVHPGTVSTVKEFLDIVDVTNSRPVKIKP